MFSSKSFTVSGLMFKSLIHLSRFLCMIYDPVSLFCIGLYSFPNTIDWKDCFMFSTLLSQINWPYMYGFVSRLCILFHWSMSPFLMPVLYWLLQLCNQVWNRRVWIPLALFFLKITLAIWSHLWFHANFRIVFSISVKNTIGFLIEIELNL